MNKNVWTELNKSLKRQIIVGKRLIISINGSSKLHEYSQELMNCWTNAYLLRLRKPTKSESSLGKFTKQCRVSGMTAMMQLLCLLTSSGVICLSRAAQVTERGVTPEETIAVD